jgi:hypothetical protein
MPPPGQADSASDKREYFTKNPCAEGPWKKGKVNKRKPST